MKILLLTQVVPFPPDSGPKVKSYSLLRYLAQRHEVHLVSFVRTEAEAANAQRLGHLCSGVATVSLSRSRLRDAGYLARSLLSGRPFLIERDDSGAMRRALDRLLSQRDFDAVHADQLSMAQFALDLPLPLRILDEHNAVWTIVRRAASHERNVVRRLLAEAEWRKLKQYEGYMCRAFDMVTVVSEEDYMALGEAAGVLFPTRVIPIAVDTDEFRYSPRTPAARHVLSLATMFYPPNAEGVHWFATRVFPLIRRELPEVRFYIVGSRPPESIRRLGRPDSGVVVTGYLADLEPVVAESGVMVVPVRSGSGMRVKILEAFSRGIPVVSTSIGVEGIDAKPNEHLLVADEPQEFARAVVRLLREPGEADRLSRAGRALAEASYDWRTALKGLNEVYPGAAVPGSVQLGGAMALGEQPAAVAGGRP